MKKIYISPLSEQICLNVKGNIMDEKFGNSDHPTVGGGDEGEDPDPFQGAKGEDWDDEDDEEGAAAWGSLWV